MWVCPYKKYASIVDTFKLFFTSNDVFYHLLIGTSDCDMALHKDDRERRTQTFYF
jgi:hypothetical protein